MSKSVLVIGGGVAGSAIAYFLGEKGYKVTLIEKYDRVGGLASTHSYAGHLYEFGPHIWFWPGGPQDEVNAVVDRLTEGKLFHVDRKLFSYVEADRARYRYPIHLSDVSRMPERDTIMAELAAHRGPDMKLAASEGLPQLGQCMFGEYFRATIGNVLYSKFMEQYSWKMWNIPGDQLKTSMVWADRFNHAYSKGTALPPYDPIKFEDHTLGKGIQFQVYPEGGWNMVWNRMVERAEVVRDTVDRIVDDGKAPYLRCTSGETYRFGSFDHVVNTIDVDNLWGEDVLPYTGRMIVPLLIPGIEYVFPEGAESIHYSGAEYQTRVTEMKVITRQKTNDAFLLIEIPILPGAEHCLPENTVAAAGHNNLFCTKAYAQQSEHAIALHRSFVARGAHIRNLLHCGRHAQFRYWGMPETVNSALQLSKEM